MACDARKRLFLANCGPAPLCPDGTTMIKTGSQFWRGDATSNMRPLWREGDICGAGTACDPKVSVTANCAGVDNKYFYSVCEPQTTPDQNSPTLNLACQLNMDFKDESQKRFCCSCPSSPNIDKLVPKCATAKDEVVRCETVGVNTETKATLQESCSETVAKHCTSSESGEITENCLSYCEQTEAAWCTEALRNHCTANDFKNMKQPVCSRWCTKMKSGWCGEAEQEFCRKHGTEEPRCDPNAPSTVFSCLKGVCVSTGKLGDYDRDPTCAGVCPPASPINWPLIWGIIGGIVAVLIIALGIGFGLRKKKNVRQFASVAERSRP